MSVGGNRQSNPVSTPLEVNPLEEESEGQSPPSLVRYSTAATTATTDKPGAERGSSADVQTVPEAGGTQRNSAESLDGSYKPPQVGKPQVIVRIRPSSNFDSTPTFEVDQQSKTIQIRVDRDRKAQELAHHKPPPGFIYFPADCVLENSSQEDTFMSVAVDVVEKAMQGIPGMIVAIGPEASGKSFSLFGLSGRYRNRGIVARALEKMFEIKDRKMGETDFKFGMGIIEVRRERIRDLLTLSPNELNDIGDRGPKGMYIEEVDCMEHGLGLLLRALIGQKLIHQEPYERSHTIIYFEIIAVSPLASELVQFQSRLTIAEIASAPYKTDAGIQSSTSRSIFYGPNTDFCASPQASKTDTLKFKSKQAVFPSRKCCNPGYTTGPLAESIAVRRDIFALEQIFLKANEMFRIRQYFHKLENLGLSMIASEKRRLSSGNNFRQNRLAHCLKDILDTSTEIRIVLHVRPDKAYLKSSLEAMRFAERARLVPSNLYDDPSKRKTIRTEDQILQEVINDIAPELMHPANVESLNSEKMRVVQEQAVQYFENNIDAMKVCSKEKVKRMFENFRVLWNFLWELELNVTLRRAEEDMKATMEKMGVAAPTTASEKDRKASLGKKESGGSGGGNAAAAADGDDEEKENAANKNKSSKKAKKEKDRKKKKERRQSNAKRASFSDPDETGMKPDDVKYSEEAKRTSAAEGALGDGSAAPGEEARRTSQPDGSSPDGVKGETEVFNTAPPEPGQEASSNVRKSAEKSGDAKRISAGNDGDRTDATATAGDTATGENNNNPTLKFDEAAEGPGSNRNSTKSANDPKKSTAGAGKSLSAQPGLSSTTHIQHARNNSTFFVRGGFADFKLNNVWGGNQDQKVLSEEERQQLAAQQEQQISNNFEEMKKIARRQAIHLLRTGVRRPQWLTLF